MKRNFLIKKREWIFIFILLLLCISAIFAMYVTKKPSDNLVAIVYYEQNAVCTVSLQSGGDETIEVIENTVYVKKEGHTVKFIDVNCPDKLCEKVGRLSKEGDMAVCLPNRCYMVLKIQE